VTSSRRNGGVRKQMKIQITPKKIRLTRVAIALIAISLSGYVAYAATQLSIGPNTGRLSLQAKNWQGVSFNPGATGFPSSAAGCPTTGYSDTPVAILFGNIPQGTFFDGCCLREERFDRWTIVYRCNSHNTGSRLSCWNNGDIQRGWRDSTSSTIASSGFLCLQ